MNKHVDLSSCGDLLENLDLFIKEHVNQFTTTVILYMYVHK